MLTSEAVFPFLFWNNCTAKIVEFMGPETDKEKKTRHGKEK